MQWDLNEDNLLCNTTPSHFPTNTCTAHILRWDQYACFCFRAGSETNCSVYNSIYTLSIQKSIQFPKKIIVGLNGYVKNLPLSSNNWSMSRILHFISECADTYNADGIKTINVYALVLYVALLHGGDLSALWLKFTRGAIIQCTLYEKNLFMNIFKSDKK